MRFEEDHALSNAPARGRQGGARSDETLPPQLAFLFREVDRRRLVEAAQAARRAKVCAASVLIADGHVSAARYYRALARHLNLDFIDGWPEIDAGTNVSAAHSLGLVRLADASSPRWLVAPRGEHLRRLLSRGRSPLRRSDLAITTPAHLASVIHYRLQPAVERAARDALPDEQPRFSARGALDGKRGLVALAAILGLAVAMLLVPRAIGLMAGFLFFLGISFRLVAGAHGLGPLGEGPRPLADANLPLYTVLVPLRDEGDILPDLLAALEAIDYPRAKLEVLLLIEPEDHRTRQALTKAPLPPWLYVVFGPWGGGLRTKPRALNIGLLMARGELLTVFDAEDRPEPNQLRIAAATFAQLPETIGCLQARLAVDNGSESLLARMFALEYAFLFDVLNIGIGNLDLPMALGGSSNHFRTSSLRGAGGWDAWNVTEDADLGLRLARLGLGVACLPSTTWEVAPERLDTWTKQRRRWLKGWMLLAA